MKLIRNDWYYSYRRDDLPLSISQAIQDVMYDGVDSSEGCSSSVLSSTAPIIGDMVQTLHEKGILSDDFVLDLMQGRYVSDDTPQIIEELKVLSEKFNFKRAQKTDIKDHIKTYLYKGALLGIIKFLKERDTPEQAENIQALFDIARRLRVPLDVDESFFSARLVDEI